MKIEGTEEELKKLFKEKKRFNLFDNKNKKRKGPQINWDMLVIILLGVAFMAAMGFLLMPSSDSLTTAECNTLRTVDMINIIQLYETNPYLAYLFAFRAQVTFILFAVGLAWIIHGVGFHLIKR